MSAALPQPHESRRAGEPGRAYSPAPVARPHETGAPEAIYHQNRYAVELDRLVTQGVRWLDIGAGLRMHRAWQGPSNEELAARAACLAGCDLVEAVLENPYLDEAQIADATHLPWPDSSFDLVSANMVLEHLLDPIAVLREVRRVLQPGGAFVFVTPNANYPVVRAAQVLAPAWLRRAYGIFVERRASRDVFLTVYRCNTPRAVRAAADAAGLGIELLEDFRNTVPVLPGWLGRAEQAATRAGADLVGVLRPRLAAEVDDVLGDRSY